ncbi:hypothetical protein FRB91_002443 [Serendipita sp. 411]|nr:hypothetical protein FRB91_002443 [Serendipita sp. 411]
MVTHLDRVASVDGLNNQLLSLCSRFIDEGVPKVPINRVKAVAELDSAISTLKQAFRKLSDVLQYHRNSSQSASALPFDILAHIFKYNDIYSVIKASCVCRWWREVAINCPLLWTFVDMKNLKCTGEYADLFLSRSGSLPLTIITPYAIDESWRHISPEVFQLFLFRARTIHGFRPLFENTEPPEVLCPQLKSLYVILRQGSQLNKILVGHTEIDHVSVRFCDPRYHQEVLFRQIDPGHYGPRVRSMHLKNMIIHTNVLMTYLLDFVTLDQLSLQECEDPDRSLDHFIATAKPMQRRPFSFLSLKDCNHTFLGGFLHPQAPNGIADTTDLVVSPEQPDLARFTGIRRRDLISRLCVNASTGVFQYIHEGGGRTWVKTKHDTVLYAPNSSYTPMGTINSVICTGTKPLDARNFRRFSNLRELSFAIAKDEHGSSLGTVLNQTLISWCRHLAYLRIQLLQPTSERVESRPSYKNNAEVVLPKFLKDWKTMCEQKFGHVIVEDEVNPERWGVLRTRIEELVGVFEVRGNVMREEEPELPSMDLFETKEDPLPEGAIVVDKFSRRATLW